MLTLPAPFKVPSLDEQERLNLDDDDEKEFDAGVKPGFMLTEWSWELFKQSKAKYRIFCILLYLCLIMDALRLNVDECYRRISHRTHHQNHGHVENDESWHPLSEKTFKILDWITRTLRFTLPFPMLAYPFYLWNRSPGKTGSHFDPSSEFV
ncbi:hypothetical protein Tco_1467916 [Tanacetum coccineum]